MPKKYEADDDVGSRPGIGVDSHGGAVIDPTQNVRELVLAESKFQNGLRIASDTLNAERFSSVRELVKMLVESQATFQNAMRDSETRRINEGREAEARRINELAATRQEYLNAIRDMLATSVQSTSKLVSDQLIQIQATFDKRVSQLEAGAFTQAGRQSVADPAMVDAIATISADMRAMKNQQQMTMTAQTDTGGITKGHADANARLIAIVMTVVAVAGFLFAVFQATRGHVVP